MKKIIKKIKISTKTSIIILVILAVIGWGFAIYFGLKTQQTSNFTCSERLEKLNAYATLLDKSNKLSRLDKSFDTLEMDIRLLDNGSLLAAWEEVVFGGNQKEDLDFYFDVIIDSLKFFSK